MRLPRAANGFVILEEAGQQQTKSGLIIPDNNDRNRAELGRIVAIGGGKKPVAMRLGDVVVYRKYTENKVFIGEQEFNFIEFRNICAVIPKGE